MKKMACILALVCVSAGVIFAQEEAAATASGERKNSIAMDLFPLFKGIIDSGNSCTYICTSGSYERLIFPHYSIGANLELYYGSIGNVSAYYFSMAAEGRYYLQSENFEKAFLGTTLGFNICSIDGSVDPYGFAGLIASLKAGYKVITSKNIYMEPSISYVLSKSPFTNLDSTYGIFGSALGSAFRDSFLPTPKGWEGGFRIGYAF